MKFKYTTSRHGGPIITVSGYRFCKSRTVGAKTHMKCSTHKGCRAIIHILDDMTIIKCHNVHNH
ncbi:Modifier of mdg4 [Operophtera brumata]|uniref:Modifier of mdg4 n=1 Tax=Operophtera brumata TaxID=104452 RepID=A0A0L7L5N9_OPEBR|nr:Modifier of mdg4 [Operophtera brumata]